MLEESVESGEERVEEILTLIEDLYGVRPTRVLDVGCGIGRLTTAFAECGIEAHGLDIGSEFIDRARHRARAAGVTEKTEFFDRDMREIGKLSGSYDLLLNVYSFGFFDEDANELLLESFRERLNPEGVLLLKLFNKEGRLANFQKDGVNTLEGGIYALTREYDPLTSRLRTEGYVLENETFLGDYVFDVRLYTPIEVKKMLEQTGFTDIHLFNTYDRDELTLQSEKQVILGRNGG